MNTPHLISAITFADESMDRLLKKDTDAPIHAIRYDLSKKADDARFDEVKAWLNATSEPSTSASPTSAPTTLNAPSAPGKLQSE